MQVKVIRSFVDKNTLVGYNAGSMYENTDSKRIQELQKAGFLEAQAPAKPAKKAAKAAKE